MPLLYSLYGLHVLSDLPIPGLQPASGSAPADVSLHLGSPPPWVSEKSLTSQTSLYTSPYLENGSPLLLAWRLSDRNFYRLRYADGTEFYVSREGTEIWATWESSSSLEDTALYLLGPVLGLVLRFRGTVCLHASGVAIRDRAVALVGPQGAGKSTSAALFARNGFSVLADDVLPLLEENGTILVQPGYPHLRLWPESVELLYGSVESLPRLTPTWEKRYLDLETNGGRFQSRPLVLSAIYILGERSDDPSAPLVESIAPAMGLITLVANTYVNYLLDETMRAREFELLGRVARGTPLRRVRPSADPARFGELCRIIVDDFGALSKQEVA